MLRADLQAFAEGRDRTPGIIMRLATLAAAVDEVPWRDELMFVLGNYSPSSDATGEVPLSALAELITNDWATKKPEPRWRLMVPPDAKGLDKRWRDAPGRERAKAVERAFLGDGDLRQLAFGEHDGRIDLRGFVEPDDAIPYRRVVDFEDLDLAGARIGSLTFMRRKIRHCRFDGVTFKDLRLFSTRIVDTSFRGADLGDMPLLDGHAESSLSRLMSRGGAAAPHIGVDFSGAKLSDLWAERRGFQDCDFSNAKLHRARFDCDLVNCRFAGHLHEVSYGVRGIFGGRAPRHDRVDLREAELHWVSFRGVELDGFRLPDDPRVRVIDRWSCVRRRLVEHYPGPEAGRPQALRVALIADKFLAAHDKAVLELATIEEEVGAEGTSELVRLLESAEATCMPPS